MNSKQRIVLILVATIIAVMLLFPPFGFEEGRFGYQGEGHFFLFSSKPRGTIDGSKLLIQWLGVILVGGVAFLLAKEQSNSK